LTYANKTNLFLQNFVPSQQLKTLILFEEALLKLAVEKLQKPQKLKTQKKTSKEKSD